LQTALFGRFKQLKAEAERRSEGETASHDLAARSYPGKEAYYESIHGLYDCRRQRKSQFVQG
jgi:hypothetical protein